MNNNMETKIEKDISFKTDYKSNKNNFDQIEIFASETIEAIEAVIEKNITMRKEHNKGEIITTMRIYTKVRKGEQEEVYKKLEELEAEIKRRYF